MPINKKIMETDFFSSIPHKTKNKSEGPKTQFNSITITYKNPNELSQTAASFYVFYHLGSDLMKIIKMKKSV